MISTTLWCTNTRYWSEVEGLNGPVFWGGGVNEMTGKSRSYAAQWCELKLSLLGMEGTGTVAVVDVQRSGIADAEISLVGLGAFVSVCYAYRV